MADDSLVDDDDESKIVTEFLLNTCRLRPSKRHALALGKLAEMSGSPAFIPLLTGSISEFYIQPMLSCVGDIDIMLQECNWLAIPDGYPPPSQLPAEFNSSVDVYEIKDSAYPGFVYLLLSYLLTENTDSGKYEAVLCDRPLHCVLLSRNAGLCVYDYVRFRS